MFPIRDITPSKNYPIVTVALIVINGLVFLYQLSLGPQVEQLFFEYGLVPVRYTGATRLPVSSPAFYPLTFISFMFLHGGVLHLLGNMWSLWIFGDNVEDHMGPLRYLVFYIACGILSGITHLFFNLDSKIPTIGASGAIAGIMGAYFLLYPRARVLTLVPVLIIPLFFELPAFIFLGLWLLIQFVSAAGSGGMVGGVAWWAHIGGFVVGMMGVKLFDLLPHTGVSRPIQTATRKKKSHRLQVVRPAQTMENLDLRGVIEVTPYEALLGAHKMVTIPVGFKNRMFRVTVPSGTKEGSSLRLKGQGREQNGIKGDLLLKVVFRRPEAGAFRGY